MGPKNSKELSQSQRGSVRLPTETDHDGRSTMLDAQTFIRRSEKSENSRSMADRPRSTEGSMKAVDPNTPKIDRDGVRLREAPSFSYRDNSGENPKGCSGKKGHQAQVQTSKQSLLFCGGGGKTAATNGTGGRKPIKKRPKKTKGGGIKGDALVLNGWSSSQPGRGGQMRTESGRPGEALEDSTMSAKTYDQMMRQTGSNGGQTDSFNHTATQISARQTNQSSKLRNDYVNKLGMVNGTTQHAHQDPNSPKQSANFFNNTQIFAGDSGNKNNGQNLFGTMQGNLEYNRMSAFQNDGHRMSQPLQSSMVSGSFGGGDSRASADFNINLQNQVAHHQRSTTELKKVETPSKANTYQAAAFAPDRKIEKNKQPEYLKKQRSGGESSQTNTQRTTNLTQGALTKDQDQGVADGPDFDDVPLRTGGLGLGDEEDDDPQHRESESLTNFAKEEEGQDEPASQIIGGLSPQTPKSQARVLTIRERVNPFGSSPAQVVNLRGSGAPHPGSTQLSPGGRRDSSASGQSILRRHLLRGQPQDQPGNGAGAAQVAAQAHTRSNSAHELPKHSSAMVSVMRANDHTPTRQPMFQSGHESLFTPLYDQTKKDGRTKDHQQLMASDSGQAPRLQLGSQYSARTNQQSPKPINFPLHLTSAASVSDFGASDYDMVFRPLGNQDAATVDHGGDSLHASNNNYLFNQNNLFQGRGLDFSHTYTSEGGYLGSDAQSEVGFDKNQAVGNTTNNNKQGPARHRGASQYSSRMSLASAQPASNLAISRRMSRYNSNSGPHLLSPHIGAGQQNTQQWRTNMLSKLTYEKIWLTPELKPKTHQTLIIFDWDDTLLPTTYLIPFQQLIYQPLTKALPPAIQKKMVEIDEYASNLIQKSKENGKVLIITNAAEGWVELSAQRFMPKTARVLRKNIEIISARTKFEQQFPRQYQEWKIRAFLECTQKLEMQAVTNIIALGDNVFEIEAAHKLYQQFQSAFIKTIKFRSAPSTGELTKQIKLVLEQFNHICHSPKNLTVRLHRIENENEKKEQKMNPHHKTSLMESNNQSQGSYTGTGDHTSNLIRQMKTQKQLQQQKQQQVVNAQQRPQSSAAAKQQRPAAGSRSPAGASKGTLSNQAYQQQQTKKLQQIYQQQRLKQQKREHSQHSGQGSIASSGRTSNASNGAGGDRKFNQIGSGKQGAASGNGRRTASSNKQ